DAGVPVVWGACLALGAGEGDRRPGVRRDRQRQRGHRDRGEGATRQCPASLSRRLVAALAPNCPDAFRNPIPFGIVGGARTSHRLSNESAGTSLRGTAQVPDFSRLSWMRERFCGRPPGEIRDVWGPTGWLSRRSW